MKKCMLIPLPATDRYDNEECQLPFIPRVGDHLELKDSPDDAPIFKVVAVGYSSNESVDYVDVYLRPAGNLSELIREWSEL